ncbi:hypothetical protein [Methanocaldococcus sp.]
MDVYETLFNLCLEHEVIVDGKKVPLWKCENIEDADLNLPWNSLRELTVELYEIRKKQSESKELIKLDIIKILVGLAFLKYKKDEIYFSQVNEDVAIGYLSDILTYRLNIIARFYYLIKKPKNTSIFEDIILKFPQNKDVRISNLESLKSLILKLRRYI